MKGFISRNWRQHSVLIFILLLASFAFFIFKSSAISDNSLLRPQDAKLIAMGKEIYLSQCASCHGENLEGQPNWRQRNEDGLLPAPPHDASGHTWHHSDQLLFEITKFGLAKISGLDDLKSDMPIYEDVLKDREIIAVLSYIKSTWPADIQKRHDQLNSKQ
jgi:mono/diheme cytochrome c family protein